MSELRNGIAVITLDNPPLNGLDAGMCTRIIGELEAAQGSLATRGIVLTGGEKAFSVGADMPESRAPDQELEPTLRSLLERVDASTKPVVAAIAGVALGEGLELALACHVRVAQETARVGLPAITLGLIPAAGGTQRLPRLAGIEAAYSLIASGQPQSARELAHTGLFDELVSEGVVDAAVRWALRISGRGAPYPKARDRVLESGAASATVAALRERLTLRQRLQPAYGASLEALTASSLPFDDGLTRERALYRGLQGTSVARALHYQVIAERQATELPVDLRTQPRAVRSLAVIGAGTMGSGIAISALDAGLAVLLLEQNEEALSRGRQRIADYYRGRVAAGKLAADEAILNEARLAATTDWTRLAEVDLVIEAVFEDLTVKQQVVRTIDRHARVGAIIASNTSYLDLDAIADATSRPADVVGLHFFSPAHVMKLLEVVRGSKTSPDVLASGMALGSTLKKVPVLSGNAFGFIGNRIYNAYRRQCEFMLEDGAWPEEVDSALIDFGFAMGPFAVADLSGLDIAWRMRQAHAPHRDPRERYVAILDRLCEMGRLGRKSGMGYYTYTDGKQSKETDSVVRDIILRGSAQRGIVRQRIEPKAIQRRAMLVMINEAALLLAEGVVRRPSDIDVVLVQGFGFPRWKGGPIFWARQEDRAQIDADMQTIVRETGYGAVLANLDELLTG